MELLITKAKHRCDGCPRDGDEVRARLREVSNVGAVGGQLELPPDSVIETVWLCDDCAMLRMDVL